MKSFFAGKIIHLLAVLCFATTLNAQKRKVYNLPNYDKQKIHFGFILGLNWLDFTVNSVRDLRMLDTLMSVEATRAPGFTLGIVSNLHLGNMLDLRFLPSLSFGERSLDYTINNPARESIIFREKKVESTFLEFPLLLKYKSLRLNNGRAYLIGGFKYVIDLASQDRIDDNNENLLKLKRNDINYELGFGIDFYLPYFKFSPEIKVAYGLNNLIVRDNSIYTNSLESIRSKAIFISFTFE
ncbi:MAG: porin family protein [Flavobacteriales bacterium]